MEAYEDEKNLVRRAIEGSNDAFEELIRLHSGKMFSVSYGLLGCKEDAEEVVQDAFIKASKKISMLREDASFSAWLYRIVVNLSRNRYKWNRSRGDGLNISISETSSDPDFDRKEDLDLPSNVPPPDKELAMGEIEKKIFDEIEKLPDTLREAVVLRHVNDMSYQQIADTLGCSLEAVKTRILRGRAIIAGKLGGSI
ncbi:MAG TPA: sigma-70 family RNA polymerase sigma factor [Victivallales bacterium]|nr:sigma-70 family RNA polymerase sigma factor [Victivallales bacterium]